MLGVMTRTPACLGSDQCCKIEGDSFDCLEDIVDHYRTHYLPQVKDEAKHFGDRTQTIVDAVNRAALSRLADDAIHGHQRRPGNRLVRDCAEKLKGHEGELAAFTTFAGIHDRVESILNAEGGNRELIAYDIAQRIGWYLGLEPECVYLHRGTRDGAAVFWPGIRAKTVALAAFPPALRSLSPAHVENLLCIYKKALAGLKQRGLLPG